jgi:hypothetical protein
VECPFHRIDGPTCGDCYRSFKKARAFARSLNLKSETEWRAYTKSSKKPDDIPANPSRTYAKDGWAGMGDWLGTGRIAPRDHQYRPFKKARAFARSLHPGLGACQSEKQELELARSLCDSGSITNYCAPIIDNSRAKKKQVTTLVGCVRTGL